MSFRFVPNPGYVYAQDAEATPFFNGKAAEALRHAQRIARGFRRTGAYEASLAAEGRRLLTDDPAGHLIEWGSVNNPPYAPLRRSIEAVGARFIDDGRRDD